MKSKSIIITGLILILVIVAGILFLPRKSFAPVKPKTETGIPPQAVGITGDLLVNPLTHAFVQIIYKGMMIYVDPADQRGTINMFSLPKADLILITHGHPDHWNTDFVKALRKDDTAIVATQEVAALGGKDFPGFRVMQNGDLAIVKGIGAEALPAYNIVRKNDQGNFFHPKGVGNGYLLTFGDKKVYIAGDTECIPELDQLKNRVDILFLPMNLPFTMPPQEAGECAARLNPKVVYPYHQGTEDPELFKAAVEAKNPAVEVRVSSLP